MSIWAALAICASVPSLARSGEPLTVLAGETAGVYFPLGVAIGKILSDALPERTVRVQVSRGSSVNLKLLAAGSGELAFASADFLMAARSGDAASGFDRPLTELRSAAALYPDFIHIVASAKSGIRTLSDLRGKRLSIGVGGKSLRKLLMATGLDEKEVDGIPELSLSEAVARIKDDKIDATLQSAGLGTTLLNELSDTSDIVLVALPPAAVAAMGKPFTPGTIPANTYRGQKDAVPTAAVMNYLVTRADLSEETVARITALILDDLDTLKDAHRAARDMSILKATQESPIPAHPGALRTFSAKLKTLQADAYNVRGEERLANGDRVGALADFATAVRIDPQHQGARDNQKDLARTIEREGAMMGFGRKQP